MKVLVNLGPGWGIRLEKWNMLYDCYEAFDKLPYGYCWAESSNFKIEYLQLSNIEKKICMNIDIIMKLYFYMIKFPIKAIKSDIVWTHNDRDALFYGFLKCIPILNKKLPKIISNIIWITDEEINNVKKKRYIRYLKKIDKIVVLSKAQIDILKNKFNIENERINFVKYGLNKEIYSDKKHINNPLRNINVCKDYILMVGTDRHRDIDLFKKITKYYKEEKFIFATNNDKFLNDTYEKNVITIKCKLSEMKWLYTNCKFIIMPLKNNTHASGCTTLIEAGLQKKAVVVNNINGLQDYLKEGITVELVEKNNLKSFINGIEKLNKSSYRKFIEDNAFKFFYNQYEYSSICYANEFKKITKNILDER